MPLDHLKNLVRCKSCQHKVPEDSIFAKSGLCKKCSLVSCLDCSRKVSLVKSEKFFINERCPSCHRKFLAAGNLDDTISLVKPHIDFTPEEKILLESEKDIIIGALGNKGEVNTDVCVVEEILIRYAAGQSAKAIAHYMASSYAVPVVREDRILTAFINRPVFVPIIKRLREFFDAKESRVMIPITNKFQLAHRLESLYLEAESVGNIRDRLLVLKTAHELLADEKEQNAPQQNFLTIIQRIEQNNRAARAVNQNFALPVNERIAVGSLRQFQQPALAFDEPVQGIGQTEPERSLHS